MRTQSHPAPTAPSTNGAMVPAARVEELVVLIRDALDYGGTPRGSAEARDRFLLRRTDEVCSTLQAALGGHRFGPIAVEWAIGALRRRLQEAR